MSAQIDREVLLSLKHVEISFDNGGKTKFKAVQDANFDIYKGETFALVGESGSGKTTIGRAILRINELSDGEITFEGKRISGKLSSCPTKRSTAAPTAWIAWVCPIAPPSAWMIWPRRAATCAISWVDA